MSDNVGAEAPLNSSLDCEGICISDASPPIQWRVYYAFCIISGGFTNHVVSRASAKTPLRLFSASKDALRIWSVKSATVSWKSQWCCWGTVAFVLHRLGPSGFLLVSGWCFLWWRCLFKANYFGNPSWLFFGQDETSRNYNQYLQLLVFVRMCHHPQSKEWIKMNWRISSE